jgi:hypothetical protein
MADGGNWCEGVAIGDFERVGDGDFETLGDGEGWHSYDSRVIAKLRHPSSLQASQTSPLRVNQLRSGQDILTVTLT